jgi:glycerol-3-phosphate acyltransferase PlsX
MEFLLRIGIDIMGSDSIPHLFFDAVLQTRRYLTKGDSLVVIATRSTVKALKEEYGAHLVHSSEIEFYPVVDEIKMAEEPLKAAHHKKNSSLVTGIRLLKRRYIDALVSAGNTGALVTSATLNLPRFPGIKRPALLAMVPTNNGFVAVLDVGGSVSCKAHHLVQFARMGTLFQRCFNDIAIPRVGLLNIGKEPQKGSLNVRQAYKALQDLATKTGEIHFVGNVEASTVFQGGVDVLVTDGFTGNVFLKTSEGLSSMMLDAMQQSLSDIPIEWQKNTLDSLQHFFNYAGYPGAILCGVERILIKCHGHSSIQAIVSSIKGAITLVNQQFLSKMCMK